MRPAVAPERPYRIPRKAPQTPILLAIISDAFQEISSVRLKSMLGSKVPRKGLAPFESLSYRRQEATLAAGRPATPFDRQFIAALSIFVAALRTSLRPAPQEIFDFLQALRRSFELAQGLTQLQGKAWSIRNSDMGEVHHDWPPLEVQSFRGCKHQAIVLP